MPPHCSVLRCAPKTFPCPTCGQLGRRKTRHTRTVIDFCDGQLRHVELQVGEYRATCPCCRTFRSQPQPEQLPLQPRARYSDRLRDVVLNRLIQDGLNAEQVRRAFRREFQLELSDGFLYDCLAWKVQQVNMADYRAWAVQRFSGTLGVDEVHLGHRVLLLATDPLNDLIVGFALVRQNDQAHMRRFLKNLKTQGIQPQIVISDGSNLYPRVLRELWPTAHQQLCVFHLLADLNQFVLDAVRRIRAHAFPPAPRRRRGRAAHEERRQQQHELEQRRRFRLIGTHRYLFVKRPDHVTLSEHQLLATLCEYAPALRVVRQFVVEMYQLFEPKCRHRQAWWRYRRWQANPLYTGDVTLRAALRFLSVTKFRKAMTYRLYSHQRQTRTNNHAERQNRTLRMRERVRYRWRRRRTIIRFLVLSLTTAYPAEKQQPPTPRKR